MKKECIKTFKQIYKDKETQQEKSFLYDNSKRYRRLSISFIKYGYYDFVEEL